MKTRPEELEGEGFKVLRDMAHDDIIPFVKEYHRKKTWASRLFNLSTALLTGILTATFTLGYVDGQYRFGEGLQYVGFGVAITFFLIPIHELLHALAYRIHGAPKTSFGANWKRFYFYAMADRFVVDRREFYLIALLPWATVLAVCMVLLPFMGWLGALMVLAIATLHNVFCSGDFALLSFFEFHRDQEVVTYDDLESGMTYFLGRRR